MTLTIELPPELAEALARRAEREGHPVTEHALAVLKRSLREGEGGSAAEDSGQGVTPAPIPRRPEGLARGVVIIGPKFDEPLSRELLANIGL